MSRATCSINRDVPPFDNPQLRRAISLTIDRQAFVDIIADGQGAIGGVMQPPPEGIWGMPPYAMRNLPGYDPDIASSRAKARKIMEKLGYGPNNRLKVTLATRNIAPYRDPAVVLIDQLKQIYIDADLQADRHGAMVSDADAQGFQDRDERHRNRGRRSGRGVLRELRLRLAAQLYRLLQSRSRQADRQAIGRKPNIEKRKKIVWEIEKKLIEDDARPILFYNKAANCRRPYLKGLTTLVNSIYNCWRFEDLWLDRGSRRQIRADAAK